MGFPYQRRLRDLREDHDKTQQDIADILGTSQTMYARYERGANELPLRHLLKLADYTAFPPTIFWGAAIRPDFSIKPHSAPSLTVRGAVFCSQVFKNGSSSLPSRRSMVFFTALKIFS